VPVRCELSEFPAQFTLSVRTRTSVSELRAVMGRVFGSIIAYLSELGVCPAGAPYAAYFNMDMDDLDIEIGVPVASALEGRGEIRSGTIPAGRAASCLYIGPYSGLEPAYAALADFVAQNGLEVMGVAYEFYLNDPSAVPPDDLATRIVFPLK
jgi:effector-binding domain-containing protein